MESRRERVLNQRKSLFVWLSLVSLPRIFNQSLAIFIGVLLLSETVAATPKQFSPQGNPPPVPLNKGEARCCFAFCCPGGWGGSSSITQQPESISQDATRTAAEKAFQEGLKLYKQGTAESLRRAIAKFEEALPLFRVLGDQQREVITLNDIGYIYLHLGQKQKALEYFNQSLPILRQVGNKRWEAMTLHSIGVVYSDLGQKQKALEFYNQSLQLSREVKDKVLEAATLFKIETVYNALGEKQKALEKDFPPLPKL
jgi:tetratricopeptide (TPR) repeat protein